MTHHIAHQYDEILNAGLPGLEIHVVYHCESEIVFDEGGNEESNRLVSIETSVNGVQQLLPVALFPLESEGKEAREFRALLRESARQALWAEQKKKSGFDDKLRTFAQMIGKPEKDFTI